MNKKESSVISDKVGITSAVLCTIHCLAIPVLFILKSWYAGQVMAVQLPRWWGGLDIIFLVISFAAVYHSSTHTKTKEIKAALWLSWGMLALSIYVTNLHWMAFIASAGLVTAHFINIRRISRSM